MCPGVMRKSLKFIPSDFTFTSLPTTFYSRWCFSSLMLRLNCVFFQCIKYKIALNIRVIVLGGSLRGRDLDPSRAALVPCMPNCW